MTLSDVAAEIGDLCQEINERDNKEYSSLAGMIAEEQDVGDDAR
jgi:hypothetical protein